MAKDLSTLKGISEADRKQIKDAQEMLGPDPETMGFVKNCFWGRVREDLVFPWPGISEEETKRCDELLAKLGDYLENEHPSIQIDQEQETPEWAVKKLMELGVMGMIAPKEYGGGGYGITSYNRVLARIGRNCGSTAVMVSAHQSIGCGALILYGTEDQKKRFLYHVGNTYLSAFCLSEPNVGSDAGGQETRCELSEDGEYYILNGEKKWATSAALSGFFTVLAKQALPDKKSGGTKDKVTALICTPEMEGIDIYSRNRSKCGIRGTWQGRIKFTNVKVPKKNLLHKEGRGLNVALTCLDYGRCTLAAGMVGAGAKAYEQALKWAKYRYQFGRPIADFELMQSKLADMAALVYAMDSMLYMTTGMLDRHDKDIMLETAICKVFCSEMGFKVVDDAMQIMGGESYMTENELERLWRDSRINRIVEGANEVMLSFIFAYGSKQLGEALLEVGESPFKHLGSAMRLGAEVFLKMKRKRPRVTKLHPSLDPQARMLEGWIQDLSFHTKRMFAKHREKLVPMQMVQARLAWASIWIHAAACALSSLDRDIRAQKAGLEDDRALVAHLCDMAGREIAKKFHELDDNTDATMKAAYEAGMRLEAKLPNEKYAIPEKTPDETAFGTGKSVDQEYIKQFGSGWTTMGLTERLDQLGARRHRADVPLAGRDPAPVPLEDPPARVADDSRSGTASTYIVRWIVAPPEGGYPMALRRNRNGPIRGSVRMVPAMSEEREKDRKFALLFGVGFDGKDGHYRQTKGEDFLLVGGSERTHEVMQDKALAISEELKRRGKKLAEVEGVEELRDIARDAGLV